MLLLVSSKYEAASGDRICSLSDIDTVLADDRIDPEVADKIRDAGAPLKIVLV